jgi:DNA-binding SARP family transcriptional activator
MEFRILGPLEVAEGGRQVAIAGSKQRALLAILLLHPNAVVSRDRLIDELWGASPPETAPTALQIHVSQLRKSLGRDVIVTRAPGYMIRVEADELDLERFEQLVEEARGKDAAAAAETLREALRLWREPPLADLDGSVALPERGQLEEQRLSALEHRIDAELELGLHGEQVPELEALVREEPLRERPRAQLMLALYRSGRQAEALDVYSKGRRLLADELGLEPGDELRRLERAILEHDPALAPTVEVPPPSRPTAAATQTADGRRATALSPIASTSAVPVNAARAKGAALISGDVSTGHDSVNPSRARFQSCGSDTCCAKTHGRASFGSGDLPTRQTANFSSPISGSSRIASGSGGSPSRSTST